MRHGSAAATAGAKQAVLGIRAMERLDELRVLLLDLGKVLLGVPGPGAVAGEDEVHLLEGALVGLGVQGPDGDNGQRVDGTKDVQRLLVEAVKDGREQQDAPAVADGPADDTPGVALGADLQREDLGRVQPGDGEPGGTKDGCVEEDEEGGGAADLGAVGVVGVDGCAGQAAGGEHADALADGAPVESPAAADPVEGEDADEGGELRSEVLATGVRVKSVLLKRGNLPCK